MGLPGFAPVFQGSNLMDTRAGVSFAGTIWDGAQCHRRHLLRAFRPPLNYLLCLQNQPNVDDAYPLLVHSMAYAKSGNKEQAQKRFDQAAACKNPLSAQ